MIILPGLGIDNIRYGASRASVKEIFGEPERKEVENWSDGSVSFIIWEYDSMGVDFWFYSDNDYKFESVTVKNKDVTLFGRKWIGLDESSLIDAASRLNLNMVLDDDFPELDSKDYNCDDLGVSFWLISEKVVSISATVLYESDNETPKWPSDS